MQTVDAAPGVIAVGGHDVATVEKVEGHRLASCVDSTRFDSRGEILMEWVADGLLSGLWLWRRTAGGRVRSHIGTSRVEVKAVLITLESCSEFGNRQTIYASATHAVTR